MGFIDAKGQIVIQPEYVMAKIFSEGLAAVATMTRDKKKLWGYIDRDGRVVIQSSIYKCQLVPWWLGRRELRRLRKKLQDLHR